MKNKKKKFIFLNKWKSIFIRKKIKDDRFKEAISIIPKITNDTINEHRENVLKGARKYIYPLRHSQHHIVRISVTLFVSLLIAFFVFMGLELYYFQSQSTFVYDVTKIIPFPVAKIGNNFVSYQSYLFELRRDVHYYETQQQVNFSLKINQLQLDNLKKEAMNEAVVNFYTQQLAQKNHLNVSNNQVNQEVIYFQKENRLGGNNEVLSNVLKDFWGWNINDFKQELKNELLQQAVVYKLDTSTVNLAKSVLNQLQHGANFASLAKKYSTDLNTKNNGGQYPQPILANNKNLYPQVVAELFSLKKGAISPIINTGYSLQILKVDSINGPTVTFSNIEFNLKSINFYISPLEKASPPNYLISF